MYYGRFFLGLLRRDCSLRAEYQEKLERREARAADAGKKAGGRLQKPLEEGTRASDQINLTDDDSRIMKIAGGGFDQCHNTQAAVACKACWSWRRALSRPPTTKNRSSQYWRRSPRCPPSWARMITSSAATGYCSKGSLVACEEARIDPFIAPWRECFAEPEALTDDAPPLKKMAHKLKTQAYGSARFCCANWRR